MPRVIYYVSEDPRPKIDTEWLLQHHDVDDMIFQRNSTMALEDLRDQAESVKVVVIDADNIGLDQTRTILTHLPANYCGLTVVLSDVDSISAQLADTGCDYLVATHEATDEISEVLAKISQATGYLFDDSWTGYVEHAKRMKVAEGMTNLDVLEFLIEAGPMMEETRDQS